MGRTMDATDGSSPRHCGSQEGSRTPSGSHSPTDSRRSSSSGVRFDGDDVGQSQADALAQLLAMMAGSTGSGGAAGRQGNPAREAQRHALLELLGAGGVDIRELLDSDDDEDGSGAGGRGLGGALPPPVRLGDGGTGSGIAGDTFLHKVGLGGAMVGAATG